MLGERGGEEAGRGRAGVGRGWEGLGAEWGLSTHRNNWKPVPVSSPISL